MIPSGRNYEGATPGHQLSGQPDCSLASEPSPLWAASQGQVAIAFQWLISLEGRKNPCTVACLVTVFNCVSDLKQSSFCSSNMWRLSQNNTGKDICEMNESE